MTQRQDIGRQLALIEGEVEGDGGVDGRRKQQHPARDMFRSPDPLPLIERDIKQQLRLIGKTHQRDAVAEIDGGQQAIQRQWQPVVGQHAEGNQRGTDAVQPGEAGPWRLGPAEDMPGGHRNK
ncbi:hypothetical protein D3C71_1635670 [compost metagenome]